MLPGTLLLPYKLEQQLGLVYQLEVFVRSVNAEGSLYSVEWTTGMDYWNGLLECPLTLNLTTQLSLLSQSGCGIWCLQSAHSLHRHHIVHGHCSHQKESC